MSVYSFTSEHDFVTLCREESYLRHTCDAGCRDILRIPVWRGALIRAVSTFINRWRSRGSHGFGMLNV